MLAPAIIACKRCGNAFQPKRLAQHYCSKQCRQNSFHQRKRSVEWGLPATTIPEKRRTDLERAPTTLTVRSDVPARVFTNGPTPGALQGDDYPLEFWMDTLSCQRGSTGANRPQRKQPNGDPFDRRGRPTG